MKKAWLIAASLFLLVAVWHTYYSVARSWMLPSPGSVMLAASKLGPSYAVTAYRSIAGFVMGSLAGLALGLLVSAAKGLPGFLNAFASVLAAVPPVVLVPLLILWLGFGEMLPIAASAIASLVPVAYNILSAMANIDPDVSDYLSTTEMKPALKMSVLSRIVMPQILPALRLSASMAWRVCFVAEMLAVPSGLGQIAYDAASVLDVPTVIAAVLALVASSYLHQYLIGLAERFLYATWGFGTIWGSA